MTSPADQRYFDDVDLGDEFEDEWVASREQVLAYLELEPGGPASNTANRFTDPEAARKIGFERPIVPGALSQSRLTRLVTDWIGLEGRLESIDVNFRRPVMHDDRLRCLGLVTDTEPGEGEGRVKLDVYLENERGERPLQGVAVVVLPTR